MLPNLEKPGSSAARNMDKHIVVTGGAGFIGSHLTERLLEGGWAVVVIDDFSTGNSENLAAVANYPGLSILPSKVSECARLTELVAGAEFVFHLAAAVGVELILKEPLQAIHTNLRETEAILEAASQAGTPLLLTSTSEVYGKSQKGYLEETDDLIIGQPHLSRWAYSCSKLMDEFLAFAHARTRNLPVTVVRLFNTAGPRQTGRFGMVMPRFVEAALRGEPLRVHGDGRQTRCFCHVADTVEVLVRLQRLPGARGQVVNIGSNEEITMVDLARRVVTTLGSKSEIQLIPYDAAYPPGFEEMHRRRPSLSVLGALTGFSPARSLEAIILDVAESIRGSRKAG